MRFEIAEEAALFADSVRSVLAGWAPPREPEFGTWWDEHDGALRDRLVGLGWAELSSGDELLAACVAGGAELGRALAPLSLVDGATLGAALAVRGRARHLVTDRDEVALVTPAGLVLARVDAAEPEPSLDGTGTMLITVGPSRPTPDGPDRLRAWSAATLGYLSGLAARSVERTIDFVTSREQFGAPLSSLAVVQARLADAALAADGIELLAWEASSVRAGAEVTPYESLLWCAGAACEVAAIAQQAHGAVGFALESGLHSGYRRAWSSRLWVTAVLGELVGE